MKKNAVNFFKRKWKERLESTKFFILMTQINNNLGNSLKDNNDVQNPQEMLKKQIKEKWEFLCNPKAMFEHFLSDPLLYVYYLAYIVYYLVFSHVHLLTLSYCCATYRSVKSLYQNDFSAFTVIIICYNLYQIFMNFYPS